MSYSDQQLEDLKERADIVAILGRRVQLKKAGKDYLGLCPFHGERTPSFNVIPGKHMYHCFGCQESGDIFKFFMKLDGMSFVEAIKHVASESGIILTEENYDPEEARKKAHLDEIATLLDRAVKFYEQKLWSDGGAGAREHLRKRGITDEFARRFHLGFGGSSMDDLSRALKKAGIPVELAAEAGLCIAGRKGDPFDRFHGRLIVPIRIPRPPDGRAIALGGRYLEGITDAGRSRPPDRKPAKYINSPETPLYQKSFVLYGLDQARDAIRKAEKAVIVEGYFDVIGVHQAGLPLAVATCGTALTQHHLDLLMRSAAKEVIFLFDGDAAGLKASAKAAEMCAKAQIPARVATLPIGEDPDEFARARGLEALQSLLERAKPAVDMLIDRALDNFGVNATVEDKVRAVRDVRDIVLASRDELARDLYFNQIAEKLRVSPAIVKSAILDPPKPAARSPYTSPRQQQDRGPHGPVGPRRTAQRSAEPPSPPPEEPPPWLEGAQAPEPPAPPRAARPPQRAAEKRTLFAEEAITVALLKHPQLAAAVAQEGVLVDFGHPLLRGLAERVLEDQQNERTSDAAQLLAALPDEVLRRRLTKSLAEDDSQLEDAARHLSRVLQKAQDQFDRARQRAKVMAARAAPPPPDADALRAQLAQEQVALEQRRVRRRRLELQAAAGYRPPGRHEPEEGSHAPDGSSAGPEETPD
jgi:DNA primase